MSHKKAERTTREDLLEQIGRLEAKVRRLQEGGADSSVKADGLAEGIAAALGKMVPGLGALIRTASGMPEFHERLAAIDEEIKRRFTGPSLRGASATVAGNAAPRRMGIPPSVRRAGTGSSPAGASRGGRAGKGTPRGAYRQPQPPKVHISPETPAQLPVDVFDEGGRIVVLAEAPGLSAADIGVVLEGTVLVLTVEAVHRKGVQRIELPCEVVGPPEMTLANGILNVHVRKAKAT